MVIEPAVGYAGMMGVSEQIVDSIYAERVAYNHLGQ